MMTVPEAGKLIRFITNAPCRISAGGAGDGLENRENYRLSDSHFLNDGSFNSAGSFGTEQAVAGIAETRQEI